MRAYFALVAVVSAVLVGQALAANISPVGRWRIGPKTDLTTEQIVEKLRETKPNTYQTEIYLLDADDKNVEVCNGKTIGDIVWLSDRVHFTECAEETIKRRAKFCDVLKAPEQDFACHNVRAYCRQMIDNLANFCVKDKEMVLIDDGASEQFLNDLTKVVAVNKQNVNKNLFYNDSLVNKKSHLEEFLFKDE